MIRTRLHHEARAATRALCGAAELLQQAVEALARPSYSAYRPRTQGEGELVVEYGGGINNGPAGQVGGGGNTVAVGGGGQGAGQPDIFSSFANGVGDLVDQVAALPTELLVIGIVAFFVGLVVLKRAF